MISQNVWARALKTGSSTRCRGSSSQAKHTKRRTSISLRLNCQPRHTTKTLCCENLSRVWTYPVWTIEWCYCVTHFRRPRALVTHCTMNDIDAAKRTLVTITSDQAFGERVILRQRFCICMTPMNRCLTEKRCLRNNILKGSTSKYSE